MFKSLNSFQKFQSGSRLWLIFFEPERNLFKQINWRMGFILQKPKDLKAVSQPVLVNTYKIFPNDSLVCLPLKKESWLSSIYNCWKQMDKPSFRVFIPLAYDAREIVRYWPPSENVYNLSYYREVRG